MFTVGQAVTTLESLVSFSSVDYRNMPAGTKGKIFCVKQYADGFYYDVALGNGQMIPGCKESLLMPVQTLSDLMQNAAHAAYSKYHANYDNALYLAAVGDDYEKGIRLGDTALALCGHPACKVDHSFDIDAAALAFLAKFI